MPHHQLCIQYAVSDGADENSYDGLRAGRLGVYDLATRRSLRIPVPIQAIPPSFQVQPIAWSPDGLWIVVGSRGFAGLPTFRVYDAETMELAPGWAPPTGGWCNRVAASNAMIAIAYGSGGTVYSIATQQVLHTLTGTSQIYDMQLSVDGTRLVVCRSTAVQVYDTTTWSLIQTGLPATEYGSVAAISPDGAWLAMGHTVGATAHLRLFETVGWTELVTGMSWPDSGGVSKITWRGDSSAVCLAIQQAPHVTVVTVPGLIQLPVSLPAGAHLGDETAISMGPLGHLAVAHTPRQYDRRVTVLAPDLATVYAVVNAPTSRAVSYAWSPPPAHALSGTVTDESDAPAAGRSMLAIHDASAAVVARTTTGVDGAYTLATPHADGHTVLLIEDDGRAQVLGSGILPL